METRNTQRGQREPGLEKPQLKRGGGGEERPTRSLTSFISGEGNSHFGGRKDLGKILFSFIIPEVRTVRFSLMW